MAPRMMNKPSHGHTKQTLGYGGKQKTICLPMMWRSDTNDA